jgi:nucleoside-diphosphate-sugar epimerase
VYHIGSGRGTSVRELAFAVADIVGNRNLIQFGASETQDDDVPILVSDPALATKVLGWQPDLDLEARIREAVDWWLARLERHTPKEVPA